MLPSRYAEDDGRYGGDNGEYGDRGRVTRYAVISYGAEDGYEMEVGGGDRYSAAAGGGGYGGVLADAYTLLTGGTDREYGLVDLASALLDYDGSYEPRYGSV